MKYESILSLWGICENIIKTIKNCSPLWIISRKHTRFLKHIWNIIPVCFHKSIKTNIVLKQLTVTMTFPVFLSFRTQLSSLKRHLRMKTYLLTLLPDEYHFMIQSDSLKLSNVKTYVARTKTLWSLSDISKVIGILVHVNRIVLPEIPLKCNDVEHPNLPFRYLTNLWCMPQ